MQYNMEGSEIHKLIEKYNGGLATTAEIVQIEQLMEEGALDVSQFPELAKLENEVVNMANPVPSLQMDSAFYDMLAREKKKVNKFSLSFELPSFAFLLPRLAFAAGFLLCGFAGGYWLNKPTEAHPDVAVLSKEIADLKEMMMLSLLEKESASERLKAVSLTSEMDQASKKVTSALLSTLNDDSNINVRLAALDALRPYVHDNAVRTELVKSISQQDSPVVQVALAELMRDMHEKKSVSEFNKILKGDRIPDDVKKRIREKISVLI
jgi:hypothetical protein